jgi:hypothetical protein
VRPSTVRLPTAGHGEKDELYFKIPTSMASMRNDRQDTIHLSLSSQPPLMHFCTMSRDVAPGPAMSTDRS